MAKTFQSVRIRRSNALDRRYSQESSLVRDNSAPSLPRLPSKQRASIPTWDSYLNRVKEGFTTEQIIGQIREARAMPSDVVALPTSGQGEVTTSAGQQQVVVDSSQQTKQRMAVTVIHRKKVKKITQQVGPDGEILSENVEWVDDSTNELGGAMETVSQTGFDGKTQTTVKGALYTKDGEKPAVTNALTISNQGQNGDFSRALMEGQLQGGEQTDTDLAIQKVLAKTEENFQNLLDQHRDQILNEYSNLFSQFRTQPSLFTGNSTVSTVQDGDRIITTSRSTHSQRMQYSSTQRIVNGKLQKSETRAFVRYQGPGGKYTVAIEPEPEEESEGEDEIEDDSKSEISDASTAIVRYGEGGNLLPKMKGKSNKLEKAWMAAQELVDTEERYVTKLHLLDQIFRKRVEETNERSSFLPQAKISTLFSNLGTLYQFHNEHLLPPLLARRRDWHQTQEISDVLKRLAPFLKMYSEYTNNYKKAIKTFEECVKKHKKFAMIVQDVERLAECDGLPLQAHIICPVQRVMRYHLLLQEYLKHLPGNHPDFQNTRDALDLVLHAANHANEMMKKLDRYKNVIEVQELLGGQMSLVSPTRELMKQGKLTKISARTDKHELRYVFLFTDLLLLCSERTFSSISSAKYKIRALLNVESMQVCEGDRLDTENTFYVKTQERRVELYPVTAKEKGEWMSVLLGVIDEYKKRLQSFQQPAESGEESTSVSPSTPPSSEASPTCPICSIPLSAKIKQKTCKSCGNTVCVGCSGKEVLPGQGKRKVRVCKCCEEKLKLTPPKMDRSTSGRVSVLSVTPSEENILSGYLELTVMGQKWVKRFFAVKPDFVLYMFKGEKDISAKTSLPLPGCQVSFPPQEEEAQLTKDTKSDGGKKSYIFKVTHCDRIYYFRTDNEEAMASWMAVLELASKAKLPEETLES